MSRIRKHSHIDKFDAHMPNKPSFIQDDWYVSSHAGQFHNSTAWAYNYEGKHVSYPMGVQKQLYHASGYGINFDGDHVGKSDYS